MRFVKSQLKIPIITFAGLSVICSFAACFFGANLKNCFIFSTYQIGVIFIPGIAATLLLHRNGRIDIDLLAFICISYSLGYALQVLLYFVTALCGLQKLIPVFISALLFAGSIPVVFKSSRRRNICINITEPIWCILFAVFLVLVFFAYSGNYVPPVQEGDTVSFHADALYWIENAAALTKTFPPAELRMSGTVLYYHYFASAYLAIANIITGIDVFSLGYAFYPLGKCFVFFGGLYELSKLFQEDKRKQFFFLFVLLFTTGLERYSIANYVAHILVLPFGFDMGFGYGAWFLAFFIVLLEVESKMKKLNS